MKIDKLSKAEPISVQLERIETTDSYQSRVNMPSVSPSMCAVVWSAPGIQILEPSLRLTSSLQTHREHQGKVSKEISPVRSQDLGKSRSMLQKSPNLTLGVIHFPHQGQSMHVDKGFRHGLYHAK